MFYFTIFVATEGKTSHFITLYSCVLYNWCSTLQIKWPYRHRRTGRGGTHTQISGNSDLLGSKRKFGQSQFLKMFPCFLYYYFEEINIFYFNLKSA